MHAIFIVFNYLICLAMDFSSGLLRVWASVLNYILFKKISSWFHYKCYSSNCSSNNPPFVPMTAVQTIYVLELSLLRYWVEGSSHAFCSIFWSIKSVNWRQYTVQRGKFEQLIQLTPSHICKHYHIHGQHFLFIPLSYKIKMRSSTPVFDCDK